NRGVQRQVGRIDEASVAQYRRSLERVAQLPDVAGPVVAKQGFSRIARQTGWRPAERFADLFEERVAQRQDVGTSFPKRGNADVEHLQPVIQILAKVAALDRFPQI